VTASKNHKTLDVTIGGIRFVATLPTAKTDTSAVEMRHMRAWERWIVETICERGSPSAEGFRFLRQRSGLKAAEVAALLGVREETISRWENGKSEVSAATWDIAIAMANDRVHGRTDTIDRLRRRQKAWMTAPKRVEMPAVRA